MQATEHDAAALPAIPVGQLIGAPGKRQMDGNTHYLWKGITRGWTLKQVLVPIAKVPMRRCCASNACESEAGSEYMFAVTCPRVLGIKRIDEQRMPTPHRLTNPRWSQIGRDDHTPRGG